MGLYNLVFGVNLKREDLLTALDLKESNFYRFRDIFVTENGEIAVYTRGGGGNRECSCDTNNPQEHGPYCSITLSDKIRQNPLYLRDLDDEYDMTYCTFYFKAPDGFDISEYEREPERAKLWEAFLTSFPKDKEG